MNRRDFLYRAVPCPFFFAGPVSHYLRAETFLRGDPQHEPILESHFPDRLHAFIWRNWELANTERLAEVLRTTPEKVLEIGYSMGLPQKPQLSQHTLRRIYVTVIRQNWHILPDQQMIELLGWDRERYEFHLREDDFLWIKLGSLKPRCEELRYEPPSGEALRRAAEIRNLVRATFGPALEEMAEPPFHFIEELSSMSPAHLRSSKSEPLEDEIDLTRGWTLLRTVAGSETPEHVIEAFHTYLRSSMGAEVGVSEKSAPGMKVLRLSVDPASLPSSSDFVVSVQPEEVHLVGHDLAGLRQAASCVQDRMEQRSAPFLRKGSVRRTTRLNPRFGYSFFALYGDPLMAEGIDPFPDGFLEKIARVGINGVWLHAVLRTLAPSTVLPEFGTGSEIRLRNLARLVDRAQSYGVKIYLYLNEPRAMPAEFFRRYPDLKGAYDRSNPDFFALCTSTSKVRQWLSDSLAYVFAQVPELGGVFCITASENLTNCYSHGQANLCPRCSRRTAAEVIAEVIQSIRDGVRRSSSKAEVIAWDWGWGEDWVPSSGDPADIIQRLPSDVALLSVSEWNQPITRGGFHTKVGEYSISATGPGPRASRHWELARRQGLLTIAKVQWNNTWEISATPYIPVPNLIVEHCQKLLKEGINGLMVSWTVGGYPSPNCDVAKEYYFSPRPEGGEALRDVALRRYGREAAPAVLDAWTLFSNAFKEFPMEGGGVVYHVPTQHGPANLLRLQPTGYRVGMVLFPYDDYKAWVGRYPVEVAERQYTKLAQEWAKGLEKFREALRFVEDHKRVAAGKDLGIAEACYLHFKSVANQIRFYRLRDEWKSVHQSGRQDIAGEMVSIAEEEIQLAKRLYVIARRDSRIAYEASNHYYYRPLDLLEKAVNCDDVIRSLRNATHAR